MRPRPSSRVLRAALAVWAMLAIAGCGYHFAASGSNLPSGAQTIYVARFTNRTRATGINDVFMRYLKDEIALHHRLQLVDSPQEADLQLTGEILAITPIPSSFNSVLEPTIYNQSMSVSAQLKDLRTNKLIWSTSSMGNLQHVPVVAQAVVPTLPTFVQGNLRGSDIAKMQDMQVATTQGAQGQDTMMQNVAKNLYASMAEGF
ncbi:MAG TPA: LPS assembly lipoprotein LptE [Candidatus Binataceae bacterium]|nr:LPS assembly lipoprotein LptE [Candidatus Binataceae bacterium]